MKETHTNIPLSLRRGFNTSIWFLTRGNSIFAVWLITSHFYENGNSSYMFTQKAPSPTGS